MALAQGGIVTVRAKRPTAGQAIDSRAEEQVRTQLAIIGAGPSLDRDAADRTQRPQELAHALYPRFLLTPAVLAVSSSPRSTADSGRKRLIPTHRAGTAHRAQPIP